MSHVAFNILVSGGGAFFGNTPLGAPTPQCFLSLKVLKGFLYTF